VPLRKHYLIAGGVAVETEEREELTAGKRASYVARFGLPMKIED
jgi:hypothetical protein